MENGYLVLKAIPYHWVRRLMSYVILLLLIYYFSALISLTCCLVPILAISLERVTKGLELNAAGVTQLGSMLFTRCVSGAR